jgi:hypothetical protein
MAPTPRNPDTDTAYKVPLLNSSYTVQIFAISHLFLEDTSTKVFSMNTTDLLTNERKTGNNSSGNPALLVGMAFFALVVGLVALGFLIWEQRKGRGTGHDVGGNEGNSAETGCERERSGAGLGEPGLGKDGGAQMTVPR